MDDLLRQRMDILKAFMITDDEDIHENLTNELDDNTEAIDNLIFEYLEGNKISVPNLLKFKENV